MSPRARAEESGKAEIGVPHATESAASRPPGEKPDVRHRRSRVL